VETVTILSGVTHVVLRVDSLEIATRPRGGNNSDGYVSGRGQRSCGDGKARPSQRRQKTLEVFFGVG